MKNKVLAVAGAAAFALTLSASASFAGYMQPGETMGVSLVSPLPEGVFFADLEDYGRSDGAGNGTVNVGVNIPVVIWSTPWSFYNTRLEFITGLPFVHIDGAVNQVGLVSLPIGPMFAHDFGNGLTGGIAPLLRTPGASQNIKAVLGETTTELDLRESLQYTFSGPGIFNGITFIQNAAYTTAFSANYYGLTSIGTAAQNDEFSGDFTAEKTFDKFTVGFTGYGNIDTDNRNIAIGGTKVSHVALGGLIAYDFGRFSLTGIVTRDVLVNNGNGLGLPGYETRGWVRLIVPLYVAPTAAPIVAKY